MSCSHESEPRILVRPQIFHGIALFDWICRIVDGKLLIKILSETVGSDGRNAGWDARALIQSKARHAAVFVLYTAAASYQFENIEYFEIYDMELRNWEYIFPASEF